MPKARKDHTCTLCHQRINKGDQYIYKTITIWDHPDNDTFGVYKAHVSCDDIWLCWMGDEMDWNFPESNYDWMEIQPSGGHS